MPTRLPSPPLRSVLARVLAFTVIALLLAGGASAEKRTQKIEKTYRLEAGGQVVLENVNGGITVETWDRDRVELQIVKEVKAGSRQDAEKALEEFEVAIDSTPQRLHVQARKPRNEDGGLLGWLGGDRIQYSASFHLRIPRRADLEIDTVNGGVEVRELEGRLDVDTVNGRVVLARTAGNAHVSTTNGRIEVAQARGTLTASTTNGSIGAEMEAVDPGADLRFSTTNGSVEVHLPRDLGAHLRARTTNGGISTDFPVEVKGRHGSKKVDAEINGGGGNVEIRTTNGAIRIREI